MQSFQSLFGLPFKGIHFSEIAQTEAGAFVFFLVQVYSQGLAEILLGTVKHVSLSIYNAQVVVQHGSEVIIYGIVAVFESALVVVDAQGGHAHIGECGAHAYMSVEQLVGIADTAFGRVLQYVERAVQQSNRTRVIAI